MRKVFVIGANSFSGQDLVRHLQSLGYYKVYGTYRTPKKEVMIGYDQSDKDFALIDLVREPQVLFGLLNQVKPEYIVNFAAQSEVAPSWSVPEDWYNMNASFVAALANFLKGKPWLHKYLHVSTPEMYGHSDEEIHEDQTYNPSTPYAASKMAGDICLKLYNKQFQLPVLFIRSANVCGPRQQLHKIIPRSMIFAMNKIKIPLHGGGTSVRGFTDIRDVSMAEELLLRLGHVGETYHVSNTEFPTVREIVEMVFEELNTKLNKMGLMPIDIEKFVENAPQRPGNDTAYILNCDKIRKFGWKPTINIRTSIHDTVEWCMNNWKEIKEMPIHYEHKG